MLGLPINLINHLPTSNLVTGPGFEVMLEVFKLK